MRKPLPHLLISFSLIGFTCATSSAQETPAAGSSVSDVVTEIRDAMNDTISKLDISVGNNLFRARQHLELLLGRIDTIAQESAGLLFHELSEAERQAFADLLRLTRELKELERVTHDDLNALTANFATSFANLPFADDLPMAFESQPLYISRGSIDNRGNVPISVSGALLAAGEPTLEIDGNPCVRAESLETSLKFLCDAEYFGNSDSIEVVTADLTVYSRSGFWDWILFRDPDQHRYALSVTVIPSVLGHVVPSVTVTQVSIQKQERTQSFSTNNGHCAGTRHHVFPFNAEEGWVVDPNSIATSCKSSKKSSCNGLRNIQERSFGYACKIENSGNCGPKVLGTRAWKDARGACWGNITWHDIKSRDSLQEQELQPVTLNWGQDERITLPEATQGVTLTLVKVNGDQSILTDLHSVDDWVTVEFDQNRRFVLVRPEPLQRAMTR